ncbi:MAG TPA: UvrD-helicase domain-containing protein, partial [Caulobacteraceae bacterium]
MNARQEKGGRGAQVEASDPRASVFVAANAGSGKTSTLVTRVARLLLTGAPPEAILCVTFTKAAAAEMQRRLFKQLGAWAVMPDVKLTQALAEIDEDGRDLEQARALFARALETPGGLKIQTIHAFCEKLLRRFPLEAGVAPGFQVLEASAAAEVSARARDDVARF